MGDWRRGEMRGEKVVAILAMLRKNQGFLDGKVATGMGQSWKIADAGDVDFLTRDGF
jgi:hypothetical protein